MTTFITPVFDLHVMGCIEMTVVKCFFKEFSCQAHDLYIQTKILSINKSISVEKIGVFA